MSWSEIGYLVGMVGLCIAFHLWTQTHDFQLGREAQRNGLALNPKWGRAMRYGWKHEFFAQLQEQIDAGRAQG